MEGTRQNPRIVDKTHLNKNPPLGYQSRVVSKIHRGNNMIWYKIYYNHLYRSASDPTDVEVKASVVDE